MSKARTLALPYALSKLLRQRSPHPIDAPGLVKLAQARGTRLTIEEVAAALAKLVATETPSGWKVISSAGVVRSSRSVGRQVCF
jgi:hypothetical protein